jgi:WD40 repeat protein/energy-coupling factor transporter ATP-binding protein EcfA2
MVNEVETHGGDFVAQDKIIYGDDVRGDKFGDSAIKVSAEQVVIYQTIDKPPSIDRIDSEPAPGAPPFKGLQYFDVDDSSMFFGREELTAELVSYLNHNQFLAIVGASGSGKSSLLRAGVIPALQKDKPLAGNVVPPGGSQRWQIIVITPTVHPLESLAAKLTQDSESVTATATLIDDLYSDVRSLHLFARRIVESDNRLLLIVDQFEELFTLCRNWEERKAFIDNLLYAASDDGVTTVVIALRSDFYSDCAGFANLRQALESHQKYIGAMDRVEMRRAIEQPAQRTGWLFEAGLVDQLLRDVGATENRQPEPGALPLLSHALLETWQRRRGRTMTFQGYAESGGVQGAIAKTAETIYHQILTPEQQLIARSIFLRLTELGEGTQGTRRRIKLDELTPRGEKSDTISTVLKQLTDARLVTTYEGEAEVAHEALIREWPRLNEWLAEDLDDLRIHRRLTHATDEWITLNFDPGLLYRGVLLAQATEWATTHSHELNKWENEFLTTSQQEEATAVNNQMRRRYILAGIIGIASILATAVILVGVLSMQQAKELRSRQLAGHARINLDINPELSIMLARAALTEAYTAEAEEALRKALQRSRILQATLHPGTWLSYVVFSVDHQRFATSDQEGTVLVRSLLTGEVIHESQVGFWVTWLAFSPLSGNLLAGADESGAVTIWNLTTGSTIIRFQVNSDDTPLTSLAFSPDERLLAIGDDNGTVRLWELATQNMLTQQEVITSPITSMAFSPAGRYLVVGTAEGEIFNLDSTTLAVTAQWIGHEENILDIAFHPEGTLFASVGTDTRLRIWDALNLADNLPRYDLEGHGDAILDVTFNKGGDCLVTASMDQNIVVWRINGLDSVDKVIHLPSGGHMVLGAEFADIDLVDADSLLEPCGTLLHTVDRNGTLQTWNIGASAEYFTLVTPANQPIALDIAPDGQRLVLGDKDGVLWVWHDFSQPPVQRVIHSEQISDVDFSPDGLKLVTVGKDGTAKVLDLSKDITIALTMSAQDHSDQNPGLNTVAFRPPDGKQILTGGMDGVVRLWDTTSGKLLNEWRLYEPPYGVYSIAFNQNGTQFATSGRGQKTYIVDINSPRPVKEYDHGTGAVILVAAYSRDGKSIITGDIDGRLTFWSQDTSAPWIVNAHQGVVNWIEFSPDGAMLATAGSDQRAILWNTATREPASILEGNLKDVTELRFMDSKDGLLLVTTGYDGSLRMYLVNPDDLARFAATRVTRGWTNLECNRYFGQSTCPQ